MSDEDRIHPERLYSPREIAWLDGRCVASVYKDLALGAYGPVYKDGRSTRAKGFGIIDRRQKKLKPAALKPPQPQSSFS
jgi:hypothetical protein